MFTIQTRRTLGDYEIKTYLYVPYSQKDVAKMYGARYDPAYEWGDEECPMRPKSGKGRWYYPKKEGCHYRNINYTELDKMFLVEQCMIPYNVKYSERHIAKEHGLSWYSNYRFPSGRKGGIWFIYEKDSPAYLPFEKLDI